MPLFPRMVNLTTKYMKNAFYKDYETSLRERSRANEFNITPWDEIWPNYQPRVIEDASRFDGASIDQLRKHFRADAIERDMLDVFPSYQNSKYEERRYHYVKLVEALEVDLSEDFQGWMKCSLPSLWEIWSDMQDTTYMKDTSSMIPDDTDVL
ncbi:hypothetical protein E8E15_001925 [Penicillium rubens]|nr:hypothetical protein E8E15_001925 [Penicillium rubens]